MDTKWCHGCGEVKSVDKYNVDNRCDDNLYYKCIDCTIETVRTCKDCNKELPIDRFGYYNKSRGYRFHICKQCRNIATKKYRSNDDRYRDYMRAYMQLRRSK